VNRIVTVMIAGAIALSGQLEAATRIKLATLAPKGTTWMKVMDEMAKEIKTKTNGEVKLKFYSGGVMGDEVDVIRKIRFGQVHGGGFTGRGLGEIFSEERVLELPRLFENYDEVDCVLEKLTPDIAAGFAKEGYVFLGWAEAGFVYIFTNKPIYSQADIKGVKMWLWEGDPLGKALFEATGIVPVPLDLPNVLTSMQTGLIDAVYASPYAAVSFQWHTRVKYMVSQKLTYATGALLVTKKQFDKLSPGAQKTVREVCAAQLRRLTELTRVENDQAIVEIKKAGIKLIDMKQELGVAELDKASRKVYAGLVGKLYPQSVLDKVLKTRDACRK
jgi:TRAP-type C4-dicarboxylate transport system substrate-binding protein